MTFVKSQSQKHDQEKSRMIFSYNAFLCCRKTPLNILIPVRTKSNWAILLPWSSATLVQITPITSNFVGSVCNNITLFRKVALPLLDCIVLFAKGPRIPSQLLPY